MDGKLTIAYQAMSQGVEDIQLCVRSLAADRDDLETFLRNLHAEWYGGGGDGWKQVQADWNTACDEITGILAQLQGALDQALANYWGADQHVQRIWGG